MHDGRMPSLKHVIDHFASGGLPHTNLDPEMRTFTLSDADKADLIAFLESLTDERPLDQVP
jgi:cytochrome c peroxidase